MHVVVAHSRYSADAGTGENVHVEREIAALQRAGVAVTPYLPSSADQPAAKLAAIRLWASSRQKDLLECWNKARNNEHPGMVE